MVVRAENVLHLLNAYQTVICARPLDVGNHEFLESLVFSSQVLARALEHSPHTSLHDDADFRRLGMLVAGQTATNAKTTSTEILAVISRLKAETRTAQTRHLYLGGPVPALGHDYRTILVVFGPALGLGDQITFLPFLKAVEQHCAAAQLTIFTLYPNFWRYLLPSAREVQYRRRPLRPFLYLEAARLSGRRELIIFADFECFDLHRKIVRQHKGRDILEIALGRRAAWFSSGRSAWIRYQDFFSHVQRDGNYNMLKRVAEQLVPASTRTPSWVPVSRRDPRKGRAEIVVLVNPFTSKKLPLDLEDWCRVLSGMRARIPSSRHLTALIFSGVTEWSRDFAAGLCRRACETRGLSAAGLDFGARRPLTPFDALPRLIDRLGDVDACLTVDTFTAHLVPLFSVPTLVITDRENRDFWVPSPWSFYVVLERPVEHRLDAIGSLLAALAAPTWEGSDARRPHGRFPDVSTAARDGMQPLIECLQRSVAAALVELGPSFPLRTQGQEWLMLWSRLAAALKRDPVDHSLLWPYLARWEESSFFKLLRLRYPEPNASGTVVGEQA